MSAIDVTGEEFEALITKHGTALDEIIGKVQELDMDEIRKQMAEESNKTSSSSESSQS